MDSLYKTQLESTLKSESAEKQNNSEKYNNKINDSFYTRLELFLFDRIIKKMDVLEIDVVSFLDFKPDDDLIKIYADAWQKKNEGSITYLNEVGIIKIKDIDNKINSWFKPKTKDNNLIQNINILKEKYRKRFVENDLFPQDKFNKMLARNCCYYCGINVDNHVIRLMENNLVYKKHFTRGKSIELDRRHPYKEYTIDNTVPCCYWCNNAKTDEFIDSEFFSIANGIKEIWNQRLIKCGLMDLLITADSITEIRNYVDELISK